MIFQPHEHLFLWTKSANSLLFSSLLFSSLLFSLRLDEILGPAYALGVEQDRTAKLRCEMAGDSSWEFGQQSFTAHSTTDLWIPLTEFGLVGSGAFISASLITKDFTGNFNAYLAVQYCAVRTTDPGTPSALSAAIVTATTTGYNATLSCDSQLTSVSLIQFALAVRRNTGGAQIRGDFEVQPIIVL